MKNRILFNCLLCVLGTLFVSCVSLDDYPTLGLVGSVNVQVGNYLMITDVDGQATRLKRGVKFEPGVHTLTLKYDKYSGDYSYHGIVMKEFYFEDGKSYTIKAVVDGNCLYCPVRERNIPYFSDSKHAMGKMQDPETHDGIDIRILRGFPEGIAYEVVGELNYEISAGAMGWNSITYERAHLYLNEFAVTKGVDAFIDYYECRTMKGIRANAIGIRYLR